MTEKLGSTFHRPDGECITSDLSNKIVGIYFSAHWCPPCRAFTPQLAAVYKELKEAGKDLEIVFISSDQKEEEMKAYHKDMPWLAVPFGDERIKENKTLYGVTGIPTLVILRDGKFLSKDGRMDVAAKAAAAYDKWLE